MRTLLAFVLLPLSILGLIAAGVGAFFLTLPDVTQMNGCMVTSMYNVRLCAKDATYTRYNDISPDLINAVVASEDAAFFHHNGFDWHELRESFTTNLRNQGFKRGGSTITQQLAKNVFLTKEKSIFRKLREAALTVDIERQFSKQQILEHYLNVVEFGPNIYGVHAASRYYFQKAPRDLNVLEASFLAFLLPNPKGYHKSFSQGALTPFAKKMLTVILRRLEGFKKISADTLNASLARLDEFPWTGVATTDLGAGVPATDTPSSSEIIENFLKSEETATPEEEAAPTEEESGESEDRSTWD